MATRVLIIDKDAATVNYLKYELKKAGMEVFSAGGGKEGLIAAWRDRPHAIVLDPTFSDMSVRDFVAKLRADGRTAGKPVIAFSSLRDPEEIQQIIEIGFNNYFAKEGDALPLLLAALQEAEKKGPTEPTVYRSAKEANRNQKEAKLVVFLSAKGGTGTSSLCANIAASLGEREPEAKIAVVDMVLPLGSLASIAGYEGPLNIVEATRMTMAEATPAYFQESLPAFKLWNFQLLAGCPDPEEANELDIARVPVILNTLRGVFDYVFVDLGRSLSRIALPIILVADQLALVMSVDPGTVELTRRVISFLEGKGMEREQLFLIINRAVGLEGMTKQAIEKALGLDIPGSYPFTEANFSLANNQHVPMHHKFPGEVAAIAMRELAELMHKNLKKRTTQPIKVSRS